LKQARLSARVLLALIDDLLDLARMERGTLALVLSPVSLADVVNRSIETVRLMAEGRGVVLILAPLPESMPAVRADPLRLQQVLWNLLANAIKFTPRHGRVIVRLERERSAISSASRTTASEYRTMSWRTCSSGSARRTGPRRAGIREWGSASRSPLASWNCTAG